MSAESARETLEAALPHKDKFFAVGLDSDERDNPPEKFAEVFAMAKDNGLHVTMHCDIDQVGSIDNIRRALTELGAERLDHGTNIVEDDALVQLVADRGIGLTSCPLSNSFVTANNHDMKDKEVKTLLERGVKVTINSDDPAYFGGYVADNFYALADQAGFTKDMLVQLARNSLEIAWVSDAERARLLGELDAFVATN